MKSLCIYPLGVIFKRLWAKVLPIPTIFICFFLAHTAQAEPLVDGSELLKNGEYKAAVKAGKSLGTSEGYALAAEALSAQIILGRFEDLNKQARKAVVLAERAVELDPENQNANVQYALAYGVMTRTTSVFKAWRKKYPAKSLVIVETLRENFPENARAEALLGAWHLGVIRKAGEKNGQKWYGASIHEGVLAFEKALTVVPNDILITGNFALSLYVLDPKAYRVKARALLETVALMPAESAFEIEVQSQMALILARFDKAKESVQMSEDFIDGRMEPL